MIWYCENCGHEIEGPAKIVPKQCPDCHREESFINTDAEHVERSGIDAAKDQARLMSIGADDEDTDPNEH